MLTQELEGLTAGYIVLALCCQELEGLTAGYIIIIIIIIIKNEKIRVTLCEKAEGALYIVNKMCVDGQRNVQG